jgi:DNA-directed RNA polymerase specialized sigma24 family protein
MGSFVDDHRAMILRHARLAAKADGEKIAAEDVAREIELELEQLAKKGFDEGAVHTPDAFVRELAKHATGRARRRHALIQQLAAGDDLDALSADIKALDSDLTTPPEPPTDTSAKARATIDKVKDALPPADALVLALMMEDGGSVDDVARSLSMTVEAVAAARDRILEKATACGVPPDPDQRGGR